MQNPSPSPGAPPPTSAPSVPPGWIAQWNEQYSQWFYVNTETNVSQWEQPTGGSTSTPNPPTGDHHQPDAVGGPSTADAHSNPSHSPSAANANHYEGDAELAARLQAEENARWDTGPTPQQPPRPGVGTNNSNNPPIEDDAALAARLQAEEDARGSGGHHPQSPPIGQNTYGQPSPSPNFYPPQQQSSYQGDFAPYSQQPGGGFGGQPYQGQPHNAQQQQQQQQQQQSSSGKSGGLLGKFTDQARKRLSAAGVNVPSGGSGGSGGISDLKNMLKSRMSQGGQQQQQQQHQQSYGGGPAYNESNKPGYGMYAAYPQTDNGSHHHHHHDGGSHGWGGHHGGHHGGHGGDNGGSSGGDGGGGGGGGGGGS